MKEIDKNSSLGENVVVEPQNDFFKRYKSNESFFSSFIDMLPSNAYQSQDENNLNWVAKSKTNVVDKTTANAVKSGGGNNKNNNKESKQPSQANSNGKSKEKRSAEDDEDDEDKDDKSKVSEKWASKFKEAKEAALKRIRQRFDSHTEPQIVKLPNSPGENNSPANGASSVAKKRANDKPKKPILNKNGEIVYSKFDFTADKTLKSAAKRKHDSSKHLTPVNVKAKDYKSLLKKLKHKREKIEELKKSEPQKAIEIEMNDKWRSAIDKASGAKVKDDPELLAKAIKRREKKKEKSKKAWEERVKGVEERKQQAQEKRKKNLDKRREKNRDKKVKRLKKKGRIMGFD